MVIVLEGTLASAVAIDWVIAVILDNGCRKTIDSGAAVSLAESICVTTR